MKKFALTAALGVLLLSGAPAFGDTALGVRPVIGVVMPTENVVSSVIPGSLAGTLGIEKGDRILTVNGTAVTDVAQLRAALGTLQVGGDVTIVFERNGQKMTKSGKFATLNNPFTAFEVKEGVGLPGQIEVGWTVDRVSKLLGVAPVAVPEGYHNYPGTAWGKTADDRWLLRRDVLGVDVGVVSGKVDWIGFFYPMVAKTSAGVNTVGTRADVIAKYGQPASQTTDAELTWFHYPAKGLSISLSGDDVRHFIVYAPRP
jgi:membrane-associated protease RseP (regulator of RpoE activity)